MSDKLNIAELVRQTVLYLARLEEKQRSGHGVLKEEVKPNGERVLKINLPVPYERRA